MNYLLIKLLALLLLISLGSATDYEPHTPTTNFFSILQRVIRQRCDCQFDRGAFSEYIWADMKKSDATKLQTRHVYVTLMSLLSPKPSISRAGIERRESFICCLQAVAEWDPWIEGPSTWNIYDCTQSSRTLSPVSLSRTYESTTIIVAPHDILQAEEFRILLSRCRGKVVGQSRWRNCWFTNKA